MAVGHTIVQRVSRFSFLTSSFLTPYNTETTYEGVMKEDDVNHSYNSN